MSPNSFSFKHWLVSELFDVDNGRPVDGQWMKGGDGSDAVFFFNLPSDPVKSCGGRPCYNVHIDGKGSISFGHTDTGTSDRFDQNQSSGTSGQQMLNAVLWAVKDHVTRVRPPALTWTSVGKSRAGAKNLNAREKVYSRLAARFLSPHYVEQGAYWVRSDLVGSWQPPGASAVGAEVGGVFQFQPGSWVANDDDSVVGQVAGQQGESVRVRLRDGSEKVVPAGTLNFITAQQGMSA